MAFENKLGQGGLWKNETKDGVKYYRGKVDISMDELQAEDGADIITLAVSVFVPDEKRSDKAPDLKVYLKRWEDRRGPGKTRFLDEPPSSVPPDDDEKDIPF